MSIKSKRNSFSLSGRVQVEETQLESRKQVDTENCGNEGCQQRLTACAHTHRTTREGNLVKGVKHDSHTPVDGERIDGSDN